MTHHPGDTRPIASLQRSLRQTQLAHAVTMLALLLTFKLLEMHARRDLFVVIFLSFFLLLTNFFYSQSILTAVAMIATMLWRSSGLWPAPDRSR